jgi:hypothetical protein
MTSLTELPPPLPADGHAAEVVRAFVAADGSLHVSVLPSFETPDAWGLLLADIARHVSRAYAADKICSEPEALERIQSLWNAEFNSPTDLGMTNRMQYQ